MKKPRLKHKKLSQKRAKKAAKRKKIRAEKKKKEERLIAKMRKMSDEELQEFMDSLRGREVVWRGYVAHVQDGYLRIQVARDNPRGAWVTLGSTWRTKLFSLRQGDLVEIRGRFRSGSKIGADVDGSSVVVVEPKSR